ncbi:PAS domain S-box protein [Acidithiobacillus thiooxidans]|uniref:PAS domain S-box protein n=1 Tax=Acidithiobacillus thiooxidans TaxID=930 RepID=UPI001B879941|nr:PAS domain S-box protein [Acidithiobacillus thiooxidans]
MTRILIVDDKEENLYYLRALLEGNGCVIESARHGAEALVKARQTPPGLVVSDLLMPVMDGYTLLRHWKADARLTDIPFIVYTATYTEEEDERLAMNLGADAFILKPCEPDDFIVRLREVQANAGADKPVLPYQPVGDENSMLKYCSETLVRKLEDRMLQLEEANRALQFELAERRSIEEELNFKNQMLQTQQETSLDAIMVVGENGEVLTFNQKFIELWGLPPQFINTHVDTLVLPSTAEQTKDPEALTATVKYLYAHRDEKSRDELRLKDGRIIDRYSAPIAGEIGKYYGRIWYFRDVTESRRAQQSLHASEREQRQLVQQLEAERGRLVAAQRVAKVGSWDTDLTTLEVIWSDETYRIFETDPDSFHPSHQNFIALVHPEDRAAVDEAFVRSLDQRVPCAIKHRILLPDGRIKFVEQNWQIFFDDQGTPVRAFGTCQDITERKQAEYAFEELSRKTERRDHMLSSALSSMSDFAQIYDPEGRILYVNQPLLDLWGIALEEAVGRNFFDLGYPEELAGRLQRQLHHVFETGQRVTDETSYVGQDDRIGYYEYIFSPVLDADQSVAFVVGSNRNITERRDSEAALRASELRYHSLFENMLEGYAYCGTIFEQDVLRDFVYLEVNRAFGRLTGLNDVVGRKISDIIPGVQKDNANLFEIYGRAALTGQPEKFETYMSAVGAWLSITVYSSDRGHFVTVFENITERKESEARILYLNRVYAVLSGISTLIVHASDRDELFREACRIAVELGGFRMALLCTVDNSTARIVPCASAGKNDALMAAIKNILSSSEDAPKTMVARAIREKRPVVSNESRDDPQVVFGRQYAGAGVNSMVVMPLINSGAVLGVLSLYASEIEFFHQEEMKLLNELADDIAYAIDHIDKQERLNYLAYYDALTGLANRNLFLERVEQLIRAADRDGQRFAIGLIDLERFKNINDSLGRPAGDALLQQVAEWLARFAHDADLLARIDADHFAFVVPEVRADGNLTELFDKVAQSFLAHPFRVGDTELRLAAKTGIALFPDDGADAEAVFKNAESALKAAKKSGDRYLFHTRKMTEAVAAKLTLENQLRQVRILLIVGTDSGDRGHPWRGNILVVVILSTGGHDGSTLGAVPGSR